MRRTLGVYKVFLYLLIAIATTYIDSVCCYLLSYSVIFGPDRSKVPNYSNMLARQQFNAPTRRVKGTSIPRGAGSRTRVVQVGEGWAGVWWVTRPAADHSSVTTAVMFTSTSGIHYL